MFVHGTFWTFWACFGNFEHILDILDIPNFTILRVRKFHLKIGIDQDQPYFVVNLCISEGFNLQKKWTQNFFLSAKIKTLFGSKENIFQSII